MRQKSVPVKDPATQVLKNIRRATRRHHSCPCCGARMFVIETFEAGCQPRHRPTPPVRAHVANPCCPLNALSFAQKKSALNGYWKQSSLEFDGYAQSARKWHTACHEHMHGSRTKIDADAVHSRRHGIH
jgi:phage terminase large subunit GpA-like protein